MDGPDSRTDKYSIIFRALLQPQFASKRPLLCRFSDAGSDEASTCSGGRRLKSAKARNRGK
jgi:hypothetical protein